MQKSMVFIDFQNFSISFNSYFKETLNIDKPNVKYPDLGIELNKKVNIQSTLMKTFLFAYKPCERLLKIDFYKNYYNWLNGLKNKYYLEVIEGLQEVRPINKDIAIDMLDSKTYTTTEKGTDVNLAVHMLSKAYSNAYDVAILVTGDTDYLPVIETLRQLGKIVVLAVLPNQNTSKYEKLFDQKIIMNKVFFDSFES